MKKSKTFNLHCTKCPRLSEFLVDVKNEHPDYHAKPVPPFGEDKPKLLIVGLAPGMHGANATGRPFTGDHAGILLYKTLFEFGFSSKEKSDSADDDLKLIDCKITNAVKCLPPQNKPTAIEINVCNEYLGHELSALKTNTVILALGGIAHKSVIKALDLKQKDYPFSHNVCHPLSKQRHLIDSYHCSRYNTQTKRLTTPMFQDVFRQARKIIETKATRTK